VIEPDLAAARGWPRPLPVVLAPARDEALSSWLARHATFYGLGITSMRRHCVPDAVSLPGLDRKLTADQEARLAHLFRRDPVAIRDMMHMHAGSAVDRLVARRRSPLRAVRSVTGRRWPCRSGSALLVPHLADFLRTLRLANRIRQQSSMDGSARPLPPFLERGAQRRATIERRR